MTASTDRSPSPDPGSSAGRGEASSGEPGARGSLLLSVRDLTVAFRSERGWVTVVDGLSYDLRRGETLGVVGESGSGKSVTNLAVMRLLPSPQARITAGSVRFYPGPEAGASGEAGAAEAPAPESVDLLTLGEREMRRIRGNRISMIFQDPMTSLNPFLRVRTQLAEALRIHDRGPGGRGRRSGGQEVDRTLVDMLERVGIPDAARRLRDYPHQFSGGMRQRVMIAMMLLNRPELLIADEPTTALDVTIQAQILELLQRLQAELRTAITLITHDLGVVAGMADEVLVMYAGRTMEAGPTDALFEEPCHPYTLGLLRSLPQLAGGGGERLYSIPGQPPNPEEASEGCPFAPRCAFVRDVCTRRFPETTWIDGRHRVNCHAVDDVREAVATGRGPGAPSGGGP